ncbi:MAG: SDR family oxidoreductase [Planctomycetota bacterium]|jgi:gluconate 5-dehydrogenase|nr:SDR family oxidoreductase [Planctomycetota bacterium]
MINLREFLSLSGRTAVVTGGASGIGLAVVGCLAGAGARVAVIARRDPDLALPALAEFGDGVRYYRFDITDTARTPETIEKIASECGPVDILVNNAGIHCKKPIEEMSVDDYQAVLTAHLVASFALTKAVIPGMRSRKRGSVIFMASMASFMGLPYVAGYASAKAGCLGMVRTLASECGSDGIRINAIAPGWIDTPMLHQVVDGDPPRRRKILGRIPMGKLGEPLDIGMAALYLASDAARYVTGACLPVDGGGLIGF